MKPRSKLVLAILLCAIAANLVAVGVGAWRAMQSGGWSATLAINLLILLVLVPFLVMELMKPKG